MSDIYMFLIKTESIFIQNYFNATSALWNLLKNVEFNVLIFRNLEITLLNYHEETQFF